MTISTFRFASIGNWAFRNCSKLAEPPKSYSVVELPNALPWELSKCGDNQAAIVEALAFDLSVEFFNADDVALKLDVHFWFPCVIKRLSGRHFKPMKSVVLRICRK